MSERRMASAQHASSGFQVSPLNVLPEDGAGQNARRRPRNLILASLSNEDLASLRSMISSVAYEAGQVLHTAGSHISDVFFVEQGLISLTVPFADGHWSTSMLIGSEGAIGLGSVILEQPAVDTATAATASSGWRLPARAVRRLVLEQPTATLAISRALSRHIAELQVELACRARHGIEQRLARLLMDMSRKLGQDRLSVTQEELAMMLGVQRTTVSALAARLKGKGALAYLRGVVRIVDLQRLATYACGCSAAGSRPTVASH
jgi:CRP-like cAMP-binding protein